MVTVALKYGEIKWNREIISNIKPFINNCNRKGINYPSKIDGKRLRKTIQKLLLIFYILKKKNEEEKMFSLYFKN